MDYSHGVLYVRWTYGELFIDLSHSRMLHWQVMAVGKKGPERSYSIDVSVCDPSVSVCQVYSPTARHHKCRTGPEGGSGSVPLSVTLTGKRSGLLLLTRANRRVSDDNSLGSVKVLIVWRLHLQQQQLVISASVELRLILSPGSARWSN